MLLIEVMMLASAKSAVWGETVGHRLGGNVIRGQDGVSLAQLHETSLLPYLLC